MSEVDSRMVSNVKHHPKYWEFHKEEFNKELLSYDVDLIKMITQDTECEEHELLVERVEQAVVQRIKKN